MECYSQDGGKGKGGSVLINAKTNTLPMTAFKIKIKYIHNIKTSQQIFKKEKQKHLTRADGNPFLMAHLTKIKIKR